MKRIRDRQCVDSEGEDRVGQALCRLPARVGGLGVYSHRECAPLGYHLRTLVRGSKAVCRHRGDENRLGHDDVCMRRNRWTVRRHDAVKTLIANALAKIDSIDARVEPRTLEGRRRNDISIRGRGISGTRALDYDIKIYSLHDADSPKTTTLPPADCTLTEHSFALTIRFLNRMGKTAT